MAETEISSEEELFDILKTNHDEWRSTLKAGPLKDFVDFHADTMTPEKIVTGPPELYADVGAVPVYLASGRQKIRPRTIVRVVGVFPVGDFAITNKLNVSDGYIARTSPLSLVNYRNTI